MNGYQEQLADAFRAGYGAVLTDGQLRRLAEACESDDPRLQQCQKVFPPPWQPGNLGRPAERCCAVAFCGWEGESPTVGQLDAAYQALIADDLQGGAGARWRFIQAWDALPRGQALEATAAACRAMLAERAKNQTNIPEVTA